MALSICARRAPLSTDNCGQMQTRDRARADNYGHSPSCPLMPAPALQPRPRRGVDTAQGGRGQRSLLSITSRNAKTGHDADGMGPGKAGARKLRDDFEVTLKRGEAIEATIGG